MPVKKVGARRRRSVKFEMLDDLSKEIDGEDEVEDEDEDEEAEYVNVKKTMASACCKCSAGLFTWSAAGSCSHCSGAVVKTQLAPEGCISGGARFKGTRTCNVMCKRLLTGERKPSPANSKCCACESGSVSWSATGDCTTCYGIVRESIAAPVGCKKTLRNKVDGSVCAQKCMDILRPPTPEPTAQGWRPASSKGRFWALMGPRSNDAVSATPTCTLWLVFLASVHCASRG